MSLNTSHVQNGGVLVHSGECIILFCKNVCLEFTNCGDCAALRGSKSGNILLSTHRMIFINAKNTDQLKSFSFPFCTLNGVELEQPLFGANFIRGTVRAQPDGGFSGDVKFKMAFKNGGCIEFGQAMLTAAKLANRHMSAGFTVPASPNYGGNPASYYPAPPPAYTPAPQGYDGWLPPYSTFPSPPPAGFIYTQAAPPPYPGVNGFVYPDTSAASAPPGAGAYPPVTLYNADQPHTAYTVNNYQDPPPPYSKKSD